ncbi:MAG: hypothetical protein ACXVB5_12580 [Isosphaeraceae bacterium]
MRRGSIPHQPSPGKILTSAVLAHESAISVQTAIAQPWPRASRVMTMPTASIPLRGDGSCRPRGMVGRVCSARLQLWALAPLEARAATPPVLARATVPLPAMGGGARPGQITCGWCRII